MHTHILLLLLLLLLSDVGNARVIIEAMLLIMTPYMYTRVQTRISLPQPPVMQTFLSCSARHSRGDVLGSAWGGVGFN